MAALRVTFTEDDDGQNSIAPPLGYFTCSAVVVSPRWLITAAHCLPQINSTVTFGGPHAATGPRVRVANAFFPQQSDTEGFFLDRDVCVVHLQSDAPNGVTFARVNSNQDKPFGDSYARAVGYGLKQDPTNPDGGIPDADDILRQVDIPVAQQELCERAYQHELIQANITRDMVCVGSSGCGPCFGDSGGPLIQFDAKGRPVVMGVVHGGVRCGDGEWPAVFTRTSSFLNWMTTRGAQFNVSDDAQQVRADGSAVAPSASPSVVPNIAGEVSGANTGSITLFALVAVGAVALLGLSALMWKRANPGPSREEVAEDSPA